MTTSVYTGDQMRAGREAVVAKLSDAWTWLEQQRYLGLDPKNGPGDQWCALTPRGKAILKARSMT